MGQKFKKELRPETEGLALHKKKSQFFFNAINRKAAVQDERKAFCLWQTKSE